MGDSKAKTMVAMMADKKERAFVPRPDSHFVRVQWTEMLEPERDAKVTTAPTMASTKQ
jgi:hypothetical protein